MKLIIKVKPRSSKNEVIFLDKENFVIYTTKSPVDGEANVAVVELISKKFDVAKSRIKILSGKKSKNKVVEIK